MNTLLFLLIIVGIICIINGLKKDKILLKKETKIKYIPRYSSPDNSLNTGENLHYFYKDNFMKGDRWTSYPYGYSDQGLDFPSPKKVKSISHKDFMNNWTWPNFIKSAEAPFYDINKKLIEQNCRDKCFKKHHTHEKLAKHNKSELDKCNNKCITKLY